VFDSICGEDALKGTDDFSRVFATMSATYQQQSLARTWKRRQRRQKILIAGVITALLVALVYGWLYVFGVF
jgi:hypothetical protein